MPLFYYLLIVYIVSLSITLFLPSIVESNSQLCQCLLIHIGLIRHLNLNPELHKIASMEYITVFFLGFGDFKYKKRLEYATFSRYQIEKEVSCNI